jgi:hypothetical protein
MAEYPGPGNTFRSDLMSRANKTALILSLVALCCLGNVARGAYRSRVTGARFAAESAAHYRYTAMVAEGRAIPAVDARAQWPEGLRVFRETSPAMEYLYGWVYRLLPERAADLPTFVRFFTAFLFSLAVFPLGALSVRLWRSRAAGVFTGLVFALALPLVARSNGFEYIRENLTLPLIVLHIACFIAACGGRRFAAPCSSVALFGALLSWHGSQFYLVPFLLFMLARSILADRGEGERRAMRWIVAAMAAAGVAVPYLRQGRFLLSIPAALAAAWLCVDVSRPAPRSDAKARSRLRAREPWRAGDRRGRGHRRRSSARLDFGRTFLIVRALF